VLFNAMIEGLLLLDRTHKIYLANRAFKNLFGLETELRSRSAAPARIGKLVRRVQVEGQMFDYELIAWTRRVPATGAARAWRFRL
jgi:PAS domain-containing protein